MSVEQSFLPADPLSFGVWLKQRRRILNLTREQLAWSVGCSFETIKKIESSDLKPSVQLAELIAKQVQVPATDLAAFVRFARQQAVDLAAHAFGSPGSRSAAAPPGPRPNTLPAPLSSFIGRTHELQILLRLLRQPGVRLLTLTGPPGVGKTRLSVEVAAQLAADFADGVCFVPLAAIDASSRVPEALLRGLGIAEVAGEPPADTLANRLRSKQVLLVLDTFEHLAAAASLVLDLLAAAPQLQVITSSRQALARYGEHVFVVPPLAVPCLQPFPPVEALVQYPAVELFVARARAAQPDFVLTGENAFVVARICALLDGLPLTIEMAAGQIQRLAPHHLLAQLHAHLLALASPAHEHAPRQQTLHGAMEWSYRLLDPAEQRLFRAFSVVVGGCTAEAAAALAPRADEHEVRDLVGMAPELAGLVDKHLVQYAVDPAGEARYSMLATVREYAHAQLQTNGEVNAARQRHTIYFVRWAKSVGPLLHGPALATWLDRLEREHENVRAAADWLMQRQDSASGCELIGALWDFWVARGHQREWLRRLETLLAQPWRQDVPTDRLARAGGLIAAGSLHWLHGDANAARRLLNEALALSEELADPHSIAQAVFYLGLVSDAQGDNVRARTRFETSLSLWRALDYQYGMSWSLILLGDSALRTGNAQHADALYTESITRLRSIGNITLLGYALRRASQLALQGGETARAIVLCQESLLHNTVVGDQRGVAAGLVVLAAIAATQGHFTSTAHLLGAAEARLTQVGAPLLPADRGEYDRSVTTTRARLDPTAYAVAQRVGRTMTLSQAMAMVLHRENDPFGSSFDMSVTKNRGT